MTFTVYDVVDACNTQKFGKAVGMDGVAMEAFIHGEARLRVGLHLCILFNLFVKHGYVPKLFMQSVIVPLVKCKTGDLSDVNNYRAIAISTSVSKLFEMYYLCMLNTLTHMMRISLGSPLVVLLACVLMF